jgi:hypothetical protein
MAEAPDGLPERIGGALGAIVVFVVFATLLWVVARNFI